MKETERETPEGERTHLSPHFLFFTFNSLGHFLNSVNRVQVCRVNMVKNKLAKCIGFF